MVEKPSGKSVLASLKPDHPLPWRAVFRGLEYSGEVVLASAWRPELGGLEGREKHFRLVLLSREEKPPRLRDPRVGVCLPALALRESKAPYGTPPSPADRQLLYRLAAGKAIALHPVAFDPKAWLGSPEKALETLACQVLAAAYPTPLIKLQGKTLNPEVTGKVFQGLFWRDPSSQAREAVSLFAPSLGLAKEKAPALFDPQYCSVFPIITEELEKAKGNLSLDPLFQKLAFSYGIPGYLGALYLLALVRQAAAPLLLRLREGQTLGLRSGEKVEDGVTWPLVPELCWQPDIADAFLSLSLITEAEAALPYARRLMPGITLQTIEGTLAEQRLSFKLREFGNSLKQCKDSLRLLWNSLGEAPDEGVNAILERLGHLASAPGLQELYRAGRQHYPSTGLLEEDLALLKRVEHIGVLTPEILGVRAYLERAVPGESDSELELDRLSLLEQVRLKSLLSDPQLWPSIKALFDWFHKRYQQVYREHHRRYHQELAALYDQLLDAQAEVEALRRLNSLTPLGLPLAPELISGYPHLVQETRPCPEGEPDLGQQPLCPTCGTTLTPQPPREEVEGFLKRLRQALSKQQQRLSSEAIRQILARSQDSRLEQFIKVAQVSDLSPLARVLDDELVEFLRELLAEVPPPQVA